MSAACDHVRDSVPALDTLYRFRPEREAEVVADWTARLREDVLRANDLQRLKLDADGRQCVGMAVEAVKKQSSDAVAVSLEAACRTLRHWWPQSVVASAPVELSEDMLASVPATDVAAASPAAVPELASLADLDAALKAILDQESQKLLNVLSQKAEVQSDEVAYATEQLAAAAAEAQARALAERQHAGAVLCLEWVAEATEV